jgi:putative hemolysin
MNTKTNLIRTIILLGLITAAACTPKPPASDDTRIANPASTFCIEQGYRSEIRTNPDGSQFGVCIFPDGSECDEWEFMHGECQAPAGNQAGGEPTDFENHLANTAKELLAEQLGVDPGEILYTGLEEATWPNGCLGLARPDEMCTEAEVPGFQLTLTFGGDLYYIRSNEDGSVMRQEASTQ